MKQAVLVGAIALSGCAGANYAMTHYSNVPVHSFTSSNGATFRIFDKPTENRMMITPSLAASMGGGAVKGITFGMANPSSSEVVFRDAAEQYIRSTGRVCRATDIAKVIDPQFEIRYTCEAQPMTPNPA